MTQQPAGAEETMFDCLAMPALGFHYGWYANPQTSDRYVHRNARRIPTGCR